MSAVVPKIEVGDDGLGEAMLALSPSHRAFVVARVFHGLNQSDAAIAAGYGEKSAKFTGFRVEHRTDVQAATAESCRRLMRTEGAASIRALIAVRDHKDTEPKDKIKAAEAILNRCGLGVVAESHLTVEHRLSPEQTDRRILQLTKELGLDDESARKLLVDQSNVIDAEFSETPAEPERTPEHEAELERRRALRAMTPEERKVAKAAKQEQRSTKLKQQYAEKSGRAQVDIEDWLNAPIEPELEEQQPQAQDAPE